MAFSFIFAGVIGYLLGSVPTAYLVVRWKSQIDIREAGSGNVGTLNSFQVTKSKLVGVAVLLTDFVKGALAVILAGVLLGPEFIFQGVAAIASVAGHNFPVWLRFRGGRGLATAAGAMVILGWMVVVVWILCWCIGFAPFKKVNVANAIASFLTLIAGFIVPDSMVQKVLAAGASPAQFRYCITFLFAFVLIKHIRPVKDYVRERMNDRRTTGLRHHV